MPSRTTTPTSGKAGYLAGPGVERRTKCQPALQSPSRAMMKEEKRREERNEPEWHLMTFLPKKIIQ
jgi:hypothetical protein